MVLGVLRGKGLLSLSKRQVNRSLHSSFFKKKKIVCLKELIHPIFMQVISRKDQAQYWYQMEVPYSYVSVDIFSRKFKESPYGKKLDEELSETYDKSQSHEDALSFSLYSLSKWELFRICASREYLLMKRNSFIYIFKTTQVKIHTFAFVSHSFFFLLLESHPGGEVNLLI